MACDYLKKQGFRILDRNYVKEWDDKTKGEIDIIAKKAGVVCFVEVKTSLQRSFNLNPELAEGWSPEDRVNYRKQKQLMKLAQTWLAKNRIALDSAWQIDVIGVVFNESEPKKSEIRHFENAVSEC